MSAQVRAWTMAVYADDAGLPTSAALTQESWHFRSMYLALDYDGDGLADGFPLAPRNPAAGVADAFTLVQGGGAAYVRVGAPASGYASVSTVAPAGGAVPSFIRVVVIRRK
jgi:hypothetical protein